MSKNTPFAESMSDDPVERAIARKVQRILNDRTLDRPQREQRVREAQRELIAHRQRKQSQQVLREHVAPVKLPQGFKAHTVRAQDGRLHVAAVNRHNSFVWLDAGAKPDTVPARNVSVTLHGPKAGGKQVRKTLQQSIAERRQALAPRGSKPAQ